MSNVKERGRLGDILLREFGELADALTEAGYDWTAVWYCESWPSASRLRWLHGRFLLAREMAAAVGVHIPDEEITQQHRERLEYLRLFPDGPPSLTDQ
ncbi:hypothetical protein EF903_05435 [Streptomyces sp. WAC05292]|uniref:hypothetical protein n=1 Tax=Streptomyces sp. WAC05292 TaxID=2487418 RepID=UPI000F73FC99|nr:hypothetical protein [Streptomyces sp. WAC05292]RSS95083.1 hypothetical protein EF903_05435 [Streptomyces sp. WAC05292]